MQTCKLSTAVKSKTQTVLFSFSTERETVVYERTPDSKWTAKLNAWRANLCAVRSGKQYGNGQGSYYLSPVTPSPLPWGHVEFDRRRAADHCIMEHNPEPVWTDGVACVFQGQRIGWNLSGRADGWMYGNVVCMNDCELLVRRQDGGTCLINPLAVA